MSSVEKFTYFCDGDLVQCFNSGVPFLAYVRKHKGDFRAYPVKCNEKMTSLEHEDKSKAFMICIISGEFYLIPFGMCMSSVKFKIIGKINI